MDSRSNYEIDLATQKPEKPKRRGITLAPGNGVQIIIKGKRSPQSKSTADRHFADKLAN